MRGLRMPVGPATLVTLSLLLIAPQAGAIGMLLEDGAARIEIDPTTQAGLNSWRFGAVEHMNQQWLWYRVGSSGPEASIDTLTLEEATLSDTNANSIDDQLFLDYMHPDFDMEITFRLRGDPIGGTETSLIEFIRIFNPGVTEVELHLFQYVDVDLLGTPNDDTAVIGPGTFVFDTVDVTDTSGIGFYQAVITPDPVFNPLTDPNGPVEVDFASATLVSLNDGGPTSLSGDVGPVGPGNVTWAVEWSMWLSPGQQVFLRKDQLIDPEVPVAIPEPRTWLLLAPLVAVSLRQHRRKFVDTAAS